MTALRELLTVLTYTSNRERPEFEGPIRQHMLKVAGDLPIVAVVQRSVDWGDRAVTEVVVGDQGASGFNMFRQVLIGLNYVRTPFVVSAEVDCLYPPTYFHFVPPRADRCYRSRNVWVMGQWRKCFWLKPEGATHAQVIGRDFYGERLDWLFGQGPRWSVKEFNFPKERGLGEDIFPKRDIEFWDSPDPIVQIKTDQSMRHYTHSERLDTPSLPYWGDAREFRARWYR